MIGGNVLQFRAGLLNFLLETARDYGPLASFRIGPKRVFLASGHNLIEKVLVTDAKYYIKHFGARVFKPVLGNGLVTSECVFWHRQRKLIRPHWERVMAHERRAARTRRSEKSELTERTEAKWGTQKNRGYRSLRPTKPSKVPQAIFFQLHERPPRRARLSTASVEPLSVRAPD